MTSEIKLTAIDSDFDKVTQEGDTTLFKSKLGVTDEAFEKLNSIGDKKYIYFYELIDAPERLELREMIKAFYGKIPSIILRDVSLSEQFISLSDTELGVYND